MTTPHRPRRKAWLPVLVGVALFLAWEAYKSLAPGAITVHCHSEGVEVACDARRVGGWGTRNVCWRVAIDCPGRPRMGVPLCAPVARDSVGVATVNPAVLGHILRDCKDAKSVIEEIDSSLF